MNEKPPPSKLGTVLFGIAFVAVLIGGLVLLSSGLEWIGNVLKGGFIEKMMNVGYSAVMWIVLALVAVAIIFGMRSK